MKRIGPYDFDERRLARWISEGRGVGRGSEYRPWLRITNVPSRGRRHRLRSTVHGRVMYLMSDLERNAVFELEWRGCTDLREQFPLDRDRTRRIADAMGLHHPRDSRTGVDIVMTTDLLRNVGIGRHERTIPYAIKPASELSRVRVMAKLEIERRYWESFGLTLHVLTDVELRNDCFEVLRWLREWYWTDDVAGLDTVGWRHLTESILTMIGRMASLALRHGIETPWSIRPSTGNARPKAARRKRRQTPSRVEAARSSRLRMDWAAVDAEMQKRVKVAVAELRSFVPPMRLTASLIQRHAAGHRDWVLKRKSKLPVTLAALVSATESVSSFQERRINYCIQTTDHGSDGRPWRIMRAAGLRSEALPGIQRRLADVARGPDHRR